MDKKIVNQRFENITWGLILVLFGGLNLIPGNQTDIFLLGFGLVLLGLNLARYISKIPTNSVTITFGAVAFIFGSYALLRPMLNLPHFELSLLPIFMIGIGIILLGQATKRPESA
jgi:hypothetical protein